MERLWEWEKINARNSIVKDGFATFGLFDDKEQYINENGLKIININQQKNNPNTKNTSQTQAASHLS
jgi:hypothetical protein